MSRSDRLLIAVFVAGLALLALLLVSEQTFFSLIVVLFALAPGVLLANRSRAVSIRTFVYLVLITQVVGLVVVYLNPDIYSQQSLRPLTFTATEIMPLYLTLGLFLVITVGLFLFLESRFTGYKRLNASPLSGVGDSLFNAETTASQKSKKASLNHFRSWVIIAVLIFVLLNPISLILCARMI